MMNYNIDKFKKIYALALQGVDGHKPRQPLNYERR